MLALRTRSRGQRITGAGKSLPKGRSASISSIAFIASCAGMLRSTRMATGRTGPSMRARTALSKACAKAARFAGCIEPPAAAA